MYEKRRRIRVPAEFEVEVLLGKDIIKLKTKTLSLKGFSGFPQDSRFISGKECVVRFSLSETLTFEIEAKVVQFRDDIVAFEFMRMNENSFSHLRRMVQLHHGDSDLIDSELSSPAFDESDDKKEKK